ncbi:hypothetical protein NG791_05820 [Laspinema sp. D1]|nr:hypothetical protein [Laspinema sp. D2b]
MEKNFYPMTRRRSLAGEKPDLPVQDAPGCRGILSGRLTRCSPGCV